MTKEPLPRVLVVIVNENGDLYVRDCVKSVLETEYPTFDVVLFDNGSTDGSHLATKEIWRQTENAFLIRSYRSTSVARATNLAIRLASHNSQYVALLDNDVIVRPDWLKKLIEVVQANPNIGSCQSLLLRTGAPGIIDGTGDFIDILGNALSRHSGERLEKLDLLRLDTDIFSARSAAMIVRRDLFEQLGGLDESFEMILEDVDLGWRIRIAGFSTRLVLDSVVLHAAGSTVKTLAKSFVMYQGTKNRVQMLLKNYEFLNLLRYVPMRVLLDLFGCLLLLMARKPELSYAIIRGLTWNLTHMPAVLRRRSVVQTRIRTVRDSRLIGKYIARKLFSRPTVVWHNLTRPHEERTVGTLTTEKGHISHYHDKTP